MIPVLKEGDHEKRNNYRPISLLPVLSKLCERIALNQLMPYLVENDRLSAHQSGNKKWHSTETSLIYTSDRILTAIDQKKTSAVVLLDMSKAFDSVNHDILLKKITRYWLVTLCHPVVQELLVKQVPSCAAYKYCSFRTPANEVRCSPRKHPRCFALHGLHQ